MSPLLEEGLIPAHLIVHHHMCWCSFQQRPIAVLDKLGGFTKSHFSENCSTWVGNVSEHRPRAKLLREIVSSQTSDMGKKTLSVLAHSFSKHQPSGPMLSISQNLRLCVHLSVRVFTFEVPFERPFAPTLWFNRIPLFL